MRIGRKIENVHDIAMTLLEIGNIIGVDEQHNAHVLMDKKLACIMELTMKDIVNCVKKQIPNCDEITIYYR